MATGSSAPPALVGFLGLGTMGAPAAARLLHGGVPLVVHTRDRSKAEPLLAAGAQWADSPRAAGRAVGAGVVFVMVSDARAVRAVLFGRSGLAAGAHPGALVVNLGTIAPDESQAVAERLTSRGLRYLEAPVGGSKEAAERGELLIFAGGNAADLEEVRPLLTRLGRAVEHVGPLGAGMGMKLVNNLVTLGTVAMDAEALAFAEALGIPVDRAADLLLAGGGESRMLRAKRDAFVNRRYPVQFRLALAAKDLKLVARTARGAGGRSPIAREVERLLAEAIRAGHAEEDFSAVFEAARARAVFRHVPPPPSTPPSG